MSGFVCKHDCLTLVIQQPANFVLHMHVTIRQRFADHDRTMGRSVCVAASRTVVGNVSSSSLQPVSNLKYALALNQN
jgi:hypothetical protein